MTITIAVSLILALLGIAVIFGADVLAAVVLRAVYAGVDERTLVQAVGRGHHFGDRRLPVAGVGGVVFTAIAATLALLTGASAVGILATAALALLLIWLVLFGRISKPINARLTAAALADEVPSDARALQDRWESIINLRAMLQGVAFVLLAVALFLL